MPQVWRSFLIFPIATALNPNSTYSSSDTRYISPLFLPRQLLQRLFTLVMIWYQIFQDGPEYEARKGRGTFTPPNLSIKDIHNAVPRHLFEKSTPKSLLYLSRHLAITYGFYYLATQIDNITHLAVMGDGMRYAFARRLLHMTLWILYWGWQGMAFAGIWCLGTLRL